MLLGIVLGVLFCVLTMLIVWRRMGRRWCGEDVLMSIAAGMAIGVVGFLFGWMFSPVIGAALPYEWVETGQVKLAPWSYDEEPDRMYIVRPEPKIYYLGTGEGDYYYKLPGETSLRRMFGLAYGIRVHDFKGGEPYFRAYKRQVIPKYAGYCKWIFDCSREGVQRHDFYVPSDKIKKDFVSWAR